MGTASTTPIEPAISSKAEPHVDPKGVASEKSRSPAESSGVTLETLQGTWSREADGMVMGEIIGSQVIWSPTYQHLPSKLIIARGKDGAPAAADIEMELEGERYWGRYEGGSRPCVLW